MDRSGSMFLTGLRQWQVVPTGWVSQQLKDDAVRMAMAGGASVIAQSVTHPVCVR